MFDLFLMLVDRIIQLKSVQAENKKELFEKVVEPTYRDIEAIYNDYRSMLASAAALVEQGKRSEAIRLLEADRERFLSVRTKLLSMGKAVRADQDLARAMSFADEDASGDSANEPSFATQVGSFLFRVSELILDRSSQKTSERSVATSALLILKGSDYPTAIGDFVDSHVETEVLRGVVAEGDIDNRKDECRQLLQIVIRRADNSDVGVASRLRLMSRTSDFLFEGLSDSYGRLHVAAYLGDEL